MSMIINPYAAAPAANASAVSIWNGLVSWWAFEQNNSDTFWDDQHTGNHDPTILASETTSARGTASGKISRGTVNNAVGSGKGARIARSDAAFDLGDVDFTVCGWFNRTVAATLAGVYFVACRWYPEATHTNYGLHHRLESGTHKWSWFVRNTSDTTNTELKSTSSAGIGTWQLVTAVHDATNNELRLYTDTTKYSAAYSGGVRTGGSANFALNSAVRSDSTIATISESLTFTIDELFVTAYAMTDDDVSYIYNGGSGKSYATFKADAGH